MALSELHDREMDDGADGRGIGRKVSLLEVGYRDISRHVDKLETQITVLFDKLTVANEAGELRLSTNIDKLQQNINERQKVNWPFVVTLLGFGFVLFSGVISGFYFLSSQNTANLLQPFALRVEVLNQAMSTNAGHLDKIDAALGEVAKQLQTNSSDDERSKQDRSDMARRLDRLVDVTSENQTHIAQLTADSGEKNTQLCAIERVQSIIAAYQARLDGEMWDQTHDKPLPPLPPFPVGLSCAPRS